jgi:hypothetical protein
VTGEPGRRSASGASPEDIAAGSCPSSPSSSYSNPPVVESPMIGGRLNAITFALRICCPSAKTRPIKDCAISAALLRSANGLSNGTIKPVFGSFAALRIAGLGARRALNPPEITSPFFNNGQNEKVSPRFFCLIRNLAPLPLSSVACGLLPKRSPPSSELGASHSCASAPITSGPSRRRTKGPPRPQPWRNSISIKSSASG